MNNDILNLLGELKKLDANLYLEENELKLNIQKDLLTQEIANAIKSNKSEIITLLSSKKDTDYIKIEKVEKSYSYSLSYSQYGLWTLCQYDGASQAYNIFNYIKLEGDYNIECFKQAILSVLERHEILRTVFREDLNGNISQVILDLSDLGFEIDYENFSKEKSPEKTAIKYIQKDYYEAFDLENGPLLRVSLLQISAEAYIFYYNMHHIISDGWSMDIISRDTFSFYKHYLEGEPLELPELRIQYKDYAAWQLKNLKAEAYEVHRRYWLNKLSGDLPILNLPSNIKRPAVKTYNGYLLSINLSKQDTASIRAYVAEKGGTLFMFLLSSLKVLFYRYTGQKDIIVSSPIAGRGHSDLENQIGFYVNTIALRSAIGGELSFDEFYENVKQDLFVTYTHEMYPFNKLIGELDLNVETGRNALYDVRVVYQNITDNNELSDVQLKEVGAIIDNGATMAKFDTSFNFRETNNHISLDLTYNTDVYDYDTIEMLLNHYQQLIRRTIECSSNEIGKLNYFLNSEASQLQTELSEIDLLKTNNKTIVDLFEAQVLETPHAPALFYENEELSYQELNDQADKLSNYLQNKYSIKPDDLIGFMLPPSKWTVISILGILKSGAGYVPIDPEIPTQRLNYLIEDTKIKTLILLSDTKEHLEADTVDELFIDEHWADIETTESRESIPRPSSNDLAYVIYTSGSTGQPKGVMITHRNLVDYTIGLYSNTEIATCKSFALMSSISTDLGNTVVYGSLLSGGVLHLPSRSTLRNAELIHNYFTDHSIDCIKIVPVHWQALLKENTYLLPKRLLVFGGDRLSVSDVEAIKNQNRDLQIVNHYGPSETTIGKLLINIDPGIEYSNIPIGKPFSESSVYVVDEQLNLCPHGISGELLIGGAGVARGYLNKPDLTAQQFIQNPFTKNKEKVYKTGDLVKMLSDGNIEFLGRKDNQVKIRGYRIELGSIERALSLKSEVKSSVVLLRRRETGEKELVGYYVSSEPIEKIEMRSFLEETLPSYMIPTYFVHLEEFPLISNGKINRKVLPDPETITVDEKIYVAPRTEQEKVMVEVWESVLKREGISITDNFYDLGGDSIKSILIVSRLKKRGYQLKVADLMQTAVLSKLTEKIKLVSREINQSVVTGEVMLTPIQKSFLTSDTYIKKSHYNQSVMLESTEVIELKLLDKSLDNLVKHHDVLRMIFKRENGAWYQENKGLSHKSYTIDNHDLSSSANYESEMGVLCDELQSSINIETGPLLKALIFKLKDKHCLLLVVHHLVVDGVSWRILLEDLSSIYESLKDQKKITLPKKTDSFKHWASVQNKYATSDKINSEIGYWEAILSNNVPPLYDADKRLDISKGNKKVLSFHLSEETVELLQTKVHRVYNTEINDILLTGLGTSIQKVFNKNNVVLILEGHGRENIKDDLDITRTVGWFTSKYPFILNVNNDFSEYWKSLVQVKEELRKLPNKGIGYGILNYLGYKFDRELKPSIVFNYLGDFGDTVNGKESNAKPIFSYSSEYKGEDSAKENDGLGTKMMVSGMIVGGELRMNIIFNDAVFEERQVSDLISFYKSNLETMIEMLSLDNQSYLTPNDLTYKNLSVADLFKLNSDNNIEDVYKLSPLQNGLYYHWIATEDKSTYFSQRSLRLQMQGITLNNIKKSYKLLIDRHSILRTGFYNADEELLQIVHKEVGNTFHYINVSNIDSKDVLELYISDFRKRDRATGFSIDQDSLIRLNILDLGSGEFEFIWSYHHILMDGWCGSVLINEFYQILMSLEEGQPLSLPEAIPYSRYIQWLDKINQATSLSYWENYLNGYDEKVSLPFEKLSGITEGYVESKETLRIAASQLKQLKEICIKSNVTENTFIQCVWGYLLSKYNSTKDVVFGSVVSGRPGEISGVENMIGLFINSIPIRIKYNDDLTISELLKIVQKDSIASLDHHYLNLSEVSSQSQLRNELFDHICEFDNFAINEIDQNFIETNKVKLSVLSRQGFSNNHYDFDIAVFASGDSLLVNFRYNSNVYLKENILQVCNHFENVLSEFLSGADKLLRDITYVSDSEASQLQTELSEIDLLKTNNKTIVDLFEAQVLETPHAPALFYENEELSYQELNDQADKLSNYLQNKYSIKPDDLIGFMLPPSKWTVISILGILKSGAGYVPIDPEIPTQRLNYLIEDTKIKTLILLSDTKEHLEADTVDELFIDEHWADIETTESRESIPRPSSNDLAYVIYTSGSTGQPKGVMITHRNLVDYTIGLYSNTEIATCKSFALMSSISTDLGNTVVYGSLLSGGVLHLPSRSTLRNAELIHNYFTDHSIDCIKIVPVHWQALLKENTYLLPKRLLVFGGDRLSVSDVEAIKNQNRDLQIVNHYGPSETTIGKLLINIDPGIEYSNIPIGKPFSESSVYVVDEQLNLCPHGISGELLIGGAGVARGYLNKPDLTAQQFIQNPFTKNKEKVYKTGDLVKMLSDGNIEFLGRKDNQVKIRGYRIELGSIERALSLKSEVKSSVVLLRRRETGEKELVGYYVSSEPIEKIEMRSFLEETLPSYMIPTYFVHLEEFPLISNGKINRKVLPDPETITVDEKIYVAPRTEQEKVMVEVWESVLKREGISITDNFYDLGGDSIKSILIVSRLKKRGYQLKVADLMQTAVLSKLTEKIKLVSREINQSVVTGEVMLTPIQKSFLTSDTYIKKSHYNQSVMLESTEVIELKLLDKSLDNLVKHHDVLRMIFKRENGAWYQENKGLSHKSYTIDNHDLSSSANYESEMGVLCDELQSSINIETGPLLKALIFKLKDKHCLLLVVHHLVVDGVSWRILLEDLSSIYESLKDQKKITLPKKTDSFKHWASVQNKYATSDKINSEIGYWEAILSNNVPPLYDADKRLDISKGNKKVLSFHLSEETVELLQTKVHRVYNTGINDILLTGLGTSIQKVFNKNNVVLDLEGHGRQDIIKNVDITRTVGWFSSFYPYLLSVSNNLSDFRTSLMQVKDSFQKIPNKGIGYGILKYLGGGFEQELETSIVFNYLGDFGNAIEGNTDNGKVLFNYSNEYSGIGTAKENDTLGLKLKISGMLVNGVLQMRLRYNDAVYDEKQIADLMDSYKSTLETMIQLLSQDKQFYLTPSDLTYKNLTIPELLELNKDNNIEDVYTLSPLQKGLYYHWISSEDKSIYLSQRSIRLQMQSVDLNNVRESYKFLIDRHSILRTGFNTAYGELLQIIHKDVTESFTFKNLSNVKSNEERELFISNFKIEDRETGFSIDQDSLIRLTLFDLGNDVYEFIWSSHHVLMDGWCSSILINEFYQALVAISAGHKVSLPEVKPYSNYIKWLEKINKESSLSYWRKYLLDYSEKAMLPFRINENITKGYLARQQIIRIESSQLKQLRKLCAQYKITENTFLQGVWGYLLSKYNNTQDVIFGSVVSGRPGDVSGVEEMIGLFINTVPVRVSYNTKTKVSDLFKGLQQDGIAGLDHHYLNLSEVQSESLLGKELIDHVFIFENYAVNESESELISVDVNEEMLSVVASQTYNVTHYDFEILVNPYKEYLEVKFRYNSNVYKEESILQLQQYFQNIVTCFIENMEMTLKDVSFLSESERSKLLSTFNSTEVVYPTDVTILDLLSRSVYDHGSSRAVSYEGDFLSYSELDIASNQLSNYLRERYNVEQNDLIGLHLDRGIPMLVSILGILKSGGAYVPMDMHYPKERLHYIASDSKYKICIDSKFLEEYSKTQSNYSEGLMFQDVAVTDLAYGIYTSGSTGHPKGVLNSHSGLYNRLLWMRDDLEINEKDIILQKTPYTFDVSVWELLMPSITGCELVFAKADGHKDPLYLQEMIAEAGITIIHFVPSMLGIFLEHLNASSCKSLRHVVCSGEALPSNMVSTFKEKLPWVQIHNLYGPTEAAIDVTSINLTDVDTESLGVSIGKPVANTRIYIVDKSFSLQPIGVAGELLIEGVQLSEGYLNRPELTSEKFIRSPFTAGGRVYRTGDLAKWDCNGDIIYIGRLDNQIKLRGNRIELGEIERRILSSGYVENSAVLLKESENGNKQLVGYVIPKANYEMELLYSYLTDYLPDYMLPSRIQTIEEFPLTISGKLDRKALHNLATDQLDTENYVAPRTELEESLVALWEEVLGHKQVGVCSNFFRIGGDSIISIRLISKINKSHKVNLSIGELYEFNTIESLCKLIEEESTLLIEHQEIKRKIANEIVELKTSILQEIDNPESIEDIYPMSDIQKGMVILSSLNPSSGVYHDQFIYEIPQVDLELFKLAFTELVWKHESLRTQFDLTSYSQEVQLVKRGVEFEIDYQDIRSLSVQDQEAKIKAYMLSERNNIFEIGSGNLWRISLFSINSSMMMFLFQFHHSILDGWSLASLNTELFQIYKQLEKGKSVNVEKLKATYRTAIIEELYEKQDASSVSFWKNELSDYKRLDIFGKENINESLIDVCDSSFKDRLEIKCKGDSVPLKTVLYSSFIYALQTLTYEDDFVIGMVSNNRPVVEDGDSLLGCFLNTIPVRNRLEELQSLTWLEYFKKIEANLSQVRKNGRLTLYEISKVTNEKAIESSPFFDVIFNYVDFYIYDAVDLSLDQPDEDLEEGIAVESFEITNTIFDFTVNLSRNSLVLKYKLRRNLKSNITLERVNECVKTILSSYLNQSEIKIKATSLYTADLDLLSTFNSTEVVYPTDVTILDLLSRSVYDHGSSRAVSYEGDFLSYSELDIASNQLSNYLRERYNVEQNDLIGLHLDRGIPMLVSILGILKSGGAYVPMDMHYPKERLHYIASDSKYKICIDSKFLEEYSKTQSNYSEGLMFQDVAVTDLAYGIYTSGSTGHPKGVLNSHSGLYNRLLWMRDDLEINEKDIILQKTPYTFDVSVWELLMPSITGCELVFAKADGHKDPLYLQEMIAEAGITIIHFVPSMLGIFLEHLNASSCKSLRHVVCSGEALPSNMVSTFKEKLPWVQIHNLYGPTEAAIDVTSINLTDVDTESLGVSIGKPVANTRIYIVDKSFSLQPIGVAGELLIEGVQLSEGYLNRPELTSEKFIRSPFTAGGRVYRTGDLAKWDCNGDIIYIGRLDNQIKLRGNRIELGEIERRILSSGYVENSAVLLKESENGNKQLVGYVIPKANYEMELLYSYLTDYLPDYMLPSRIQTIEEFPLTISGKLDRKALHNLATDQLDTENYVAPRTELEESLVALWEDILGYNNIGVRDNFFEIGGNSLNIIRLSHLLKKELNATISVVDFFNNNTIESIANLIDSDTTESRNLTEKTIDVVKF